MPKPAIPPSTQTLITGQEQGGSPISTVGQLRNRVVSVNAPKDIGTLLIDSLLLAHGIKPNQVHFANNVPFPGVAAALTAPKTPISAATHVRPRAIFSAGG